MQSSSSIPLGREGVSLGALGCVLVVLQLVTATIPLTLAPSTFEPFKVSELSLPLSGIMGLSPLIQPVRQTTRVFVSYPHSLRNSLGDRGSYWPMATIYFRCIQPTRRITVNANSEWYIEKLIVKPSGNFENLAIGGFYFNPQDETLYVDLVESLKVDVEYYLHVELAPAVIDQDDGFGIQIFNQTRQDTGDIIITTSLSSAPKAVRRFVPCFDDPAFIMPYTWIIHAEYGIYGAAIGMMNAPRNGVSHHCSSEAGLRYSRYYFSFPPMAIEAMQLRIVPFSWYPKNDAATPPPPECF